jgi:hypothetical protein
MDRAVLSLGSIPAAVRKLRRRLEELRDISSLEHESDLGGLALILANKMNATIDDVLGSDTADAHDFQVNRNWFLPSWGPLDWEQRLKIFMRGRDRAIAQIKAAIERLEEKLADSEEDAEGRSLRAYEGFALHSEIARAANDLYRDGHFANAVEASVKARSTH